MIRRLVDARRKRKAARVTSDGAAAKAGDAPIPHVAPLLSAPPPPAPAPVPPPVQADDGVPLPPANPDRDEMNRRLSLDGDLPESARRPDQNPATTAAAEGLVRYNPSMVIAHMDVAGCSEAGWEPAKPDPNNVSQSPVLEVRKENQDAYAILAPFARHSTLPQLGEVTTTEDAELEYRNRHMMFLGVFDGHGAEGRPIAHFVRDNIAKMTLDIATRNPNTTSDAALGANPSVPVPRDVHRARMEALKSAFSRAERGLTDESNRIDHLFSGTTAVVSWMFGDDVYTAWAGDSRCIVGRAISGEDGRTCYRPVDLSHDQKPSRVDEKRRVKAQGGRIARWRRNIGPLRVWLPRDWIPGLAMTRSIGDTVLSEFGVSPVPEVTYTRLCAADAFMVLASDGVWEFMTSQEVVDFVGRMLGDGKSAQETSTALVKEAVRKWRRNEVVVDDTTAVVMHLRVDPPSSDHTTGVSQNGVSGEKGTADYGRSHHHHHHHNGSGVEPLPHSKRGHRMEKSALGKLVFNMGHLGQNKNGRQRPNGTVLVVGDDGKLSDFVCKNDNNVGG